MSNLQITDWISGLSALATLAIAVVAFLQLRTLRSQADQTRVQLGLLKSQLEQTSAQILTTASNDHNWRLFEHRDKLPAFLPSWSVLNTDKKWAWRVLHLNHLNLLQLACQEYKRGLISEAEMISWRDKAKFWYRNVWEPTPDTDTTEGRDILRQVLRPEEGFPKEFRDWMVRENIIPPNFMPD